MKNSKALKLIISTVLTGIILFAWVGIAQNIPWGIPTTRNIIGGTNIASEATQAANAVSYAANELTTPKFDEVMVNNVSTLTTEKTFSWVISKPLSYFNTKRYLAVEFATQIIIALLLSGILMLTIEMTLSKRMLLIFLMAVMTSISGYGRLTNWSGLTGIFAIGESVNLIIGWLLGGFISAKLIMKPVNKDNMYKVKIGA